MKKRDRSDLYWLAFGSILAIGIGIAVVSIVNGAIGVWGNLPQAH